MSSAPPKPLPKLSTTLTEPLIKNNQTGKALRECCIFDCRIVSDTPHRLSGMAGEYTKKSEIEHNYVCRTHWNVDYNKFKRNRNKNKKPEKSDKSKKSKSPLKISFTSSPPSIRTVRSSPDSNNKQNSISKHFSPTKRHRNHTSQDSSPVASRLRITDSFSINSPLGSPLGSPIKTPSPSVSMASSNSSFNSSQFVTTPWGIDPLRDSTQEKPPLRPDSKNPSHWSAMLSSSSTPWIHQGYPQVPISSPLKSGFHHSNTGSSGNSSASSSQRDFQLKRQSSIKSIESHSESSISQSSDIESISSPVVVTPPQSFDFPIPLNHHRFPSSTSHKNRPPPGFLLSPSYPGDPISIPFRFTSILDRDALFNLSKIGEQFVSSTPKSPPNHTMQSSPNGGNTNNSSKKLRSSSLHLASPLESSAIVPSLYFQNLSQFNQSSYSPSPTISPIHSPRRALTPNDAIQYPLPNLSTVSQHLSQHFKNLV